MKQVPTIIEYKGKFSHFYRERIEPQLPTSLSVSWMHKELIHYIKDDSIPLIVRKFEGSWNGCKNKFSSRGRLFNDFSRPFICSDNEAALWFYARAVNQDYMGRIGSIKEALKGQCFTIGFSTDKKKNENKDYWKKWGKEHWENKIFSSKGWLHAHLHDVNNGFDISDLSLKQLKIRSFRYLHPANHFPIPSFKKFQNLNIDEPKDMGASENIKHFIFKEFSKRYADIWDEFLIYCESDFTPEDFDSSFAIAFKPKPKS